MKKNIYILLLSLFIVCFSACSFNGSPTITTPTPTKLVPPTISYDKGYLFWKSVNGADKYELEINGDINITYGTQFSLPVSVNPIKYNVRIKSISEDPLFLNSDFSNMLYFETRQLLSVSIDNISYNANRSKATIYLTKNDEEKINIFINDIFLCETSTSCFELSNRDVQYGYNTLTLTAKSNSPYILDSETSSYQIYKSQDFDDVKLEKGDLLCRKSPDSKYEKYNTDSFESGKHNALVTNFDNIGIDQPNAKIVFCSDGILMNFYKIAPANIVSCSYIRPYNSKKHSVHLKLRNFKSNPETDDRLLLGYDYNKIEILITIDSYGNKKSFTYDVPVLNSYTECTFSFYSDLSDFSSTPSSIIVTLHKDGYISSTPVYYKF